MAVELLLDLRRCPAAVVVVDLQAEGAGAARHRLADPSHADDAQAFSPDAVAEHPGRRPAAPRLVVAQHGGALGEAARHGEDERHGHVGGILGEDTGRVGHGDAAAERGRDVDMVNAVAVIGDQLELVAGLAQDRGIDAIGHGRHQHVGTLHGIGELGRGHGLVVEVEARVEQLAHAGLDAVRQLARDDDQRLFAVRHGSTCACPRPRGTKLRSFVEGSLTTVPETGFAFDGRGRKHLCNRFPL